MSSLLDIALAVVALAIVWPLIRARIRLARPGREGAELLALLNRALTLRVAMALVLNVSFAFGSGLAIFWGDSAYYDDGGWLAVRFWAGESSYAYATGFGESGSGWVNVVAGIYYVIGRNQIFVQFLNCILGTLTVFVVYLLAQELFGAAVAQRTARLMAYFPGMVIWASGMYKDPAILLSIATAMLAVTRLRARFSTGWVLMYLGSALWLLSLRFYVFYFLVIATLGTFVFGQKRGFVASFVTNGLLLIAFYLTFTTVVGTTTAERQLAMMTDLQDLQRRRTDLVQSAGSGFAAAVNISTPAGALAAIPVGAVYLLFAPFPWAISGFRQALTVPETLYWYSLMPAFLVGLRVALRDRFGPAMPMLVFAATLIAAYSVMQGNVGTAYRQRTQVTMFFFILMALGQEETAKRRLAGRGPLGLGPNPDAVRGSTNAQTQAPGPRGWSVPSRTGAGPRVQPPGPNSRGPAAQRPVTDAKGRGTPPPPLLPPRRGA